MVDQQGRKQPEVFPLQYIVGGILDFWIGVGWDWRWSVGVRKEGAIGRSPRVDGSGE